MTLSVKTLDEAIRAFNTGHYFDAHEHFEALWKTLEPASPEKTLLQALVQLSVALHHGECENATGYANVLKRACDNFAKFRKGALLPDTSPLVVLDTDDVIAQAAMLETEPDDRTLLAAFRLKTKTPGR